MNAIPAWCDRCGEPFSTHGLRIVLCEICAYGARLARASENRPVRRAAVRRENVEARSLVHGWK